MPMVIPKAQNWPLFIKILGHPDELNDAIRFLQGTVHNSLTCPRGRGVMDERQSVASTRPGSIPGTSVGRKAMDPIRIK